MTASEDTGDANSAGRRCCASCSAPLAPDQRYCLECGARRGPLPRRFAELIGTVLEQEGPATQEADAAGPEPERIGDGPTFPEWMPAPRAAAVAILLMLAFGVYAGSLFSPTVESLAHQLIVVVSPAPVPAPVTAASANGSGSSGGGGSTQVTQTVTVGGGGAGGGGSGGGGSATTTSSTSSGGTSNPALKLPPIHHVFVVMLSDQDYFQTFGPVSSDRYLSKTLPKQGELIQNYYGVAGSPLANGIASISGQGPTLETSVNCPLYTGLLPGTNGSHGQIIGGGCVYPPNTLTIADQLTAVNLTWRAYVQGIGGTSGKSTGCVHPGLGSSDNHATPGRRNPYVTWRNPFVYFGSLTGGSACRTDEVGLGKLSSDVKHASTAPTLSYIIPSPCDDGSDQPCAPGAKAGLAPADKFLKTIVPEIEHSAAYKDNGLLMITFDQAPQSGPHADHSSCCRQPKYPNLPSTAQATSASTGTSTASSTSSTSSLSTTTATPTTSTTSASTDTTSTATTSTGAATTTTPSTTSTTTTTPSTTSTTTTTPSTTSTTTTTTSTTTSTSAPPGAGGGQVGILLISPFITPGSTDVLDSYNHFSLLRSIEDLFGLSHLGFAGEHGLAPFDSSTYNNYTG